ncbi:MAG TPA: type II toxin-antitoxin system prevent-host-death family antitoxin, partial [Anaerolineales bacterium]|nr:type II toxin-antitoxin system prevent-host-death family antitoxin [Anaerolineales bacterium]
MTRPILREVNAPYTVNPDDEALGRETIIIHKNGEPVAAVVPYAEYQKLLALTELAPLPPQLPSDPQFEKQYAAFQRLLPELLKEHRGE